MQDDGSCTIRYHRAITHTCKAAARTQLRGTAQAQQSAVHDTSSSSTACLASRIAIRPMPNEARDTVPVPAASLARGRPLLLPNTD